MMIAATGEASAPGLPISAWRAGPAIVGSRTMQGGEILQTCCNARRNFR